MILNGFELTTMGIFICYGLCVGSFLNVVIYRLPKPDMSLSKPGSHCPLCESPIRWYDNIPVLSYLLLGQCCRICKSYIPWRYPLIELATGLLFAYVAYIYLGKGMINGLEFNGNLAVMAILQCVFVAALLAISFIDIDFRIIPDEMSKHGMWVVLILSFLVPQLHSRFEFFEMFSELKTYPRLWSLFGSVIGLSVGYGAILAVQVLGKWMFRKEAMGSGDVKLMGMIGAFIGWDSALLAIVLASLFGMVYGVANMVIRKDNYMPFGPCLALGAVLMTLHYDWMMRLISVEYPLWLERTFF